MKKIFIYLSLKWNNKQNNCFNALLLYIYLKDNRHSNNMWKTDKSDEILKKPHFYSVP